MICKPFSKVLFWVFVCVIWTYALPSKAKQLHNQAVIDAFYMEQDGEPLWLRGTRLNKAGKTLHKALQNAWHHGLNPNSYNVATIDLLISHDEYGDRSSEELALKLEVLLTDGYVRYVQDLSGMRVNAYELGLRQKDWLQRISAQDALALLPEDLDDIDEFLERRGPQTATYQKLKAELISLVDNSDENLTEFEPISIRRTLYPGRKDDNVPALRLRLGGQEPSQEELYLYDSLLVQAVEAFQAEHGLKPDGIVGKQTLHALNHGKEDKITQLIVNMERLRWVPDEKPERFVVVNIPSARLWAIDNGSVAFTMPVIVGRKKRPTLSFVTKIHGVRFNPTWTVPPTIKEEDILPSLLENPSYLADKGMELFDGYGRDAPTLDPMVVDWASLSKQELNNLNMVQVPGAHNPLGLIRILMPNEHNIYLHDTNNKSLFYKADRAQSSGCVRMQDPERMAQFALKNRKGWANGDLKKIIASKKMTDLYTNDHVTVYLLYYTVWLGEAGQIIYGRDIYNNDQRLLESLKKLDGVPIIGDNGIILSTSAD